jgi:uncharacterized protein YjlB
MMERLVIEKHFLSDDGAFPNNYSLPLLVYKDALTLDKSDDENALSIEKLFRKNDWKNSWRDGIYDYHHYHSTAHEVLGVYSGEAAIQVGGPKGPILKLKRGDVIIIPVGIAHKCINDDGHFKCVGAYPGGQNYDMNYGLESERAEADKNIKNTDLPGNDPVFGKEGPLDKWWDLRGKAMNENDQRKITETPTR